MTATYAGIDVGKDHLDLAVLAPDGARARRFANDPAGVAELAAALAAAAPALVALEATGVYHRAAHAALAAAGLPVAVVNPAQARAFRDAGLGRQKTDRQDALLLARLARAHEADLRPAVPAAPQQARLRALVAYRDGLVAERTRLRNRAHAADRGGEPAVQRWLAADLAAAEGRLAEVEAEIGRALAGLPEAAVLTAAVGVGPLVAAAVLAYVPAALWGDAKAAAAYAGVHPRREQSGQRDTSRLSKQGHRRLRRYLYLAALAAARWDPELAAFHRRRLARGKPPRSAACAVMHKLLRRLMGRLRALYAAAAAAPPAAAA